MNAERVTEPCVHQRRVCRSWALAGALLAVGCRQGASRARVDAALTDGAPHAAVDGGVLDAGDGVDAANDASSREDAGARDDDAALGGGHAELGADASAPVVQDCLTFLDRSADQADRTLAWNFDLGASAERCLQIAAGQSVTWSGAFRWHPLSALGGDLPSPIPGAYPDEGDHTLTFPVSGTYGFICEVHTEMRGAIRVVP
jgi:hypothetical protein